MIIIWIIVAILLFSIIILVHEYGHFKSARIFWVRVEEFWLGIPPRAKKLFKDKKWTLYSLNWLPLWWFVKLSWEQIHFFKVFDKDKKLLSNQELEKYINNWDEIFSEDWKSLSKKEKEDILEKIKENKASYNLVNKPFLQQSIIILAWVFMNFLLAFLIFSVLFFIWVKPIWINDKIDTNLNLKIIPTYEQAIKEGVLLKGPWVILSPLEWSIAGKSWLINWDFVKEIYLNWENISINNTKGLIDIISSNPLSEVIFRVDCNLIETNWDCALYDKKDIKVVIWADWKIWSYIWDNISVNDNFIYKYWFIDSIRYGFYETYAQSVLTIKSIWLLFKNIVLPEKQKDREEAIDWLKWPIWIVDFISGSIWFWIMFIIIIWAIISINLWVFNLLPIPALDWWRFLFILINSLWKKIFWKKIIWYKFEVFTHVIFFVFLIALSLLIAYNDINNIIRS